VGYVLGWTKGFDVPALVTTSPPGTLRDEAGVLGNAGTSVLFGATDLSNGARSGGRATLGYWFNDCHNVGLEFGYLGLEQEDTQFTNTSQGDPILARPFFNAQTNVQDASLVAFPDFVTGSILIDATTEFQALDMSLRRCLYDDCCGRGDLFIGYRYVELNDGLRIGESTESQDIAVGVPPGTTIDLQDLFETENRFHGGRVELVVQRQRCRWSVEMRGSLSLGSTSQEVLIDGVTTVTTPDAAESTTAAALLALPTNIGRFEQDTFTLIPEFGVKLGYELGCGWRASLGYSLLYWSSVARPGDQIDRTLNLSQLPPGPLTGPERPRFAFLTNSFWTQGLDVAVEYQF
jgi:hypothetical protein